MDIYNTTLDEFIRVFFQFLKKEKAYGNFKRILYKNCYFKEKPNYEVFFKYIIEKEYVDKRHPTDCLFSTELFCIWANSPQQYVYWARLYLKWAIITYNFGYWKNDNLTLLKSQVKNVRNRANRIIIKNSDGKSVVAVIENLLTPEEIVILNNILKII